MDNYQLIETFDKTLLITVFAEFLKRSPSLSRGIKNREPHVKELVELLSAGTILQVVHDKGVETDFVAADNRTRRGKLKRCEYCTEWMLTRVDQPARFCSSECLYDSRKNKVSAECAHCGKTFERAESKIGKTKSGLQFCSRWCKDVAQRIDGIKSLHPKHYKTGKSTYRNLFEEGELYCRRCGYDEFTCAVAIHHVDENRENNKKSNLLPLCNNCHMALHNECWKLEDL